MKTLFFKWFGENLALDFVNTASWPGREPSNERLTDYTRLLAWAKESPMGSDIGSLKEMAVANPADAARVTDLALKIRTILHEIFSAAVEGRVPEEKRLAQFNAALSAALDRIEISALAKRRFAWSWAASMRELEEPLWPILWEAARLLTSPELRLVRRCANPVCGRLFGDRSRRGNRRWCSMSECGNRAKAHRHYVRITRE